MRLCPLFAAFSFCGLSTGHAFTKRQLRVPEPVFPPPLEILPDINVQDEFALSIETPDLQNIQKSKLILGNGLKVYIVSDPGIVYAGAALSVETGNWRDPPGVSGLAHFTEHMLFMGSEEFPAEGEYDRYVKDHGGYNNAYTSNDHTVYYFNLLRHGLLGGLDRLSQFFVAPLFNTPALERERKAVNSEYNLGKQRDSYRLWYVIQDIMRPTNHPFSHFGCGNLTTLSSLDQTNVSAWFKTEYDPRGMHLAVFSHEPLQLLERRVKSRFGKIPFSPQWKGPIRAASSGDIIPAGTLGSWVFVEPLKDLRKMMITWPIPEKFASRGNRIAEVAASVLGGVGDGTLLSKLKAEAVATSVVTDVDNDAADAAFFTVHIELTAQGLAKYPRVVQILFESIGAFGRLDFPAHIVEEHNTLSSLKYKWQERWKDARALGNMVAGMREEDLATYPHKSWFWEHAPYDVTEIFLDHLSPNNSIIFIQSKSSKNFNVTFDNSEPIAGAKYSITNFTDDDFGVFNDAHQHVQADYQYSSKSLYIPDPNVRVFRSIDSLQVNRSRFEPLPEIVNTLDSASDSFLSTYIAGDVEFGTPKISFRNSFFSPALNIGGNPLKEIVLQLWMDSVYETTQTMRAGAALGGYSFSINVFQTPSPRLTITVSGFSSRDAVSTLMQGIYSAIRFPQIRASRLRTAIDDILALYRNQEQDVLYKQVNYLLSRWFSKPTSFNTPKSLIAEIDKIRGVDGWEATMEDEIGNVIHQVFRDGGKGFHEFSLYGGNVEVQDVRSIQTVREGASLVPSLPVIPPLSVEEVFRPSFINKTDRPVLLHGYRPKTPVGQSSVRLVVPTGSTDDPKASAFTDIMDNLCGGVFFAALRTRDQLGYVVACFSHATHSQQAISFFVQGETLNGTSTLARINEFIQDWIVTGLCEKDEYTEIDGDNSTTNPFAEHFDKAKDAVVKGLEAKHPSMEAKTVEHETLLLWHRDNLDLPAQSLAAVKNTTREDFRATIKSYFGDKSDWRAVALDGSEGLETLIDARFDGWTVCTEDSLDAETAI